MEEGGRNERVQESVPEGGDERASELVQQQPNRGVKVDKAKATKFAHQHGYSTVSAMAADFDRERDAALMVTASWRAALSQTGQARTPKEPEPQIGMSRQPQ